MRRYINIYKCKYVNMRYINVYKCKYEIYEYEICKYEIYKCI